MNGQSLSKPFCDKRVLYVVLNWKIQDIWPVLKKDSGVYIQNCGSQ